MPLKRMPVTGAAANRHGIVQEHWRSFSAAATRTGYAILVREGKPAAVRWIRNGYPAKPLSFKIKVHPGLGLLLAESEQERREYMAHPMCYLVPLLSAGEPPSSEDKDKSQRLERFIRDTIHRHRESENDPNNLHKSDALPALLVDRRNNLPFTSDYDLAAVVDTKHPHYEVTFMSHGSLGESKSRTNCMVDALTRHLNQQFGSDRIQHGTEAQYSGQAANKDDEGLILFRPGGQTEFIHSASALESWQVVRDLMLEYHPEMVHVFNQ